MKFISSFVVFAFIAIVSFAAPTRIGTKSLVESVRSRTNLWQADIQAPYAHLTADQVRHELLGISSDNPRKIYSGVPVRSYAKTTLVAPESYDPRKEFPQCNSLRHIRDQSGCGSCWAFGAVEMASDRICMAIGTDVELSAEDMNSCSGGMGCHGGMPEDALDYWYATGLVTEKCRPYSLPSCDHHIANSSNPCPEDIPTPACNRTCVIPMSWKKDKHYAREIYGVKGEADMMVELSKNGPCEAAMHTYEDFLVYKSGIYHHVTGASVGYHAIKIMGYGVENGTKYWLLANSWNEHWGEKGFFRMLRGNSECEIENLIYCGTPLEKK